MMTYSRRRDSSTNGIFDEETDRINVEGLSREEVNDLAVAARGGDEGAWTRLYGAMSRLVVKIALNYRQFYKDLDDLVQCGNMGLCRAVQGFRPDRGDFVPYAGQSIRWAVRDGALRDRTIPSYWRHMNMDRGPHTAKFLSLDADLEGDGSLSLHGSLQDHAPRPDSGAIDNSRDAMVRRYVAKLSEGDALCLCMRYGIGTDPCTYDDISEELGISREGVRQRCERGLEKIRKMMRRDGLVEAARRAGVKKATEDDGSDD